MLMAFNIASCSVDLKKKEKNKKKKKEASENKWDFCVSFIPFE